QGRFDRLIAAAESMIDREDDPPGETLAEEVGDAVAPAADSYGFHVDDPDDDLLYEEADTTPPDEAEPDALDVLAEAFNARDLERVLDLVALDGEVSDVLGYDRDNLPVAIEDLWV